MKIALIGATGFVGAAILKEALQRGHEVRAIARDTTKIKEQHASQVLIDCDVMDADKLAQKLKGNDVIISAYNAGWANPDLYDDFLLGTQSIQQAARLSGVKRFIVVGGAGSLYIKPGVQLVDTPEFPAEWKSGALAARDYLDILKKEDQLDWVFLSPALEMHPGTSGVRKGHYRTSLDTPVFDENNRSIIAVEDIAVAILDEAENAKHHQQRFTVAY